MTRGSRRRTDETLAFALINTAFMVAGAAVAAVTLYPVYGSTRMVVVAVGAIVAGAVIALVCIRRGWSRWTATGLGLAAYVGLGLGVAMPSFTGGNMSLPAAVRELVRAPIGGWKDIVTLPLPLGQYGGTLLPTLALVLAGTLLAVWLAAAARRWWGLAAAVIVWMVATTVLLGPVARADELSWAPYGVYFTREFVVGLGVFAVLLGWFAWRAAYVRRRALAHTGSGARLATVRRVREAGTVVIGALMVALAVVVAALVSGPVAAQTPRDVARSVVEPRIVVNSTITPLAAFRTYFTDAAYNEVLFTVSVSHGNVDRVRIATLPYFDGDAFTAAAPQGKEDEPFARVPSHITPPAESEPITATITVGDSASVWVPMVGALGSVQFHGPRSGALVDSFFYQGSTLTGLVTVDGGLTAADSYTVDAFVPRAIPRLEQVGAAPGGVVIDSARIPQSLTDWVTRQGVSRTGAGLAQLVATLREQGYLSHALTEPSTVTEWQRALGSYAFAGSAAGSSYDRIDRLFADLNARALQVADTPGASLVAAVGDDEQFAAAVALMAADLGFSSRVVMGVRLTDTDPTGWSAPPCEDGVCRGKNLSAWVEVQAANGTWVPIDVTPQHQNPPSPEVNQERDPKFASDVDPERAHAISPPASQRGSASEVEPLSPESQGLWDALGPVLRVVGIGLLTMMVLLAPFVAVVVWKGLRRRRRRAGPPRDAIHQGWDEYLDTAVDAGFPPLPLATRLETAREYGSLNGVRLAHLTDRTTFGPASVVADDANEFWRLVAAERASWLASKGFWSRMRMRLSLRSLWHVVAMQAPQSVVSTVNPANAREAAEE